MPSFDYGGFVVGEEEQEAILNGKSKGILCGVPFFQAVFDELDCRIEWFYKDGDLIPYEGKNITVAKVYGKARNILMGERTALNIMTRASGIATAARAFAEVKKAHKWHGEIAATRKTTPGFRIVEKYAVLVGGCSTHRMDLSSMVMLKDNHVWSTGSIAASVKKARTACGFSTKIEVEARSLEEAYEAAGAGADIIMLDNFTGDSFKEAAAIFKSKYPHIIIEGSGGITVETVGSYMCPYVDVLSAGSLTQGYSALDFSLKIKRK